MAARVGAQGKQLDHHFLYRDFHRIALLTAERSI